MEEFSRTELLIGPEGLAKLKESKVAIFGIGGVGSFAAEALARSGLGHLVMIDHDKVSASNINRQILATQETIGQAKVEAMRDRVLTINPACQVTIFEERYLPDTSQALLANDYDYIIDAVDMVTAKLDLVVEANQRDIPIICAMGAGNKMDPTRFEVADIYQTSICPLAKVMRKELRKRGIPALKVLYSKELPIKILSNNGQTRRPTTGSIAFVPPVAGLIIAGEVIKDLMGYER